MRTLGFITLLAGTVLGAAGCQQETQMTTPAPVTQAAIPTRA